MNIIRVVCGLIEDDSGRVLVCRRKDSAHLGGKWEFPGGKIEHGESAESALRRELLEELSIDVIVGDSLTTVLWHYADRSIQLHPYRCRIVAGTIHLSDHSESRWCDVHDLELLDWAEADIPIQQEYSRLLGHRIEL